MAITVNERYRPFCHRPGTLALVPGTSVAVKAYPTRLEFYHAKGSLLGIAQIPGTAKTVAVQQDLERGCLTFWRQDGLRGHCRGVEGGFNLTLNRPIEWPEGSPIREFAPRQWHFHADGCQEVSPSKERLYLGCSKQQDWELIRRREALEELLPLWFALGNQTHVAGYREGESLLQRCQQAEKEELPECLLDLYRAGFSLGGMLFPQVEDSGYHGYPLPPVAGDDPLAVLSEGAALIRSLFCALTDGGELKILPKVPPLFHAGKMTGVTLVPGLEIDIEWTKKKLRRLVLHVAESRHLQLLLPRVLRRYRFKAGKGGRGEWQSCGTPLSLEGGLTYTMDRFEI